MKSSYIGLGPMGSEIIDLEAYPIAIPVGELEGSPISIPFSNEIKDVVFGYYRSVIILVRLQDGTVGFGECMTRLAPRATGAIVQELRPLIIGQDALNVERIWERNFAVMMNRGHNRGFFSEALSGIDIAIWDARARFLGLPIYHCLGGLHNSSLPIYASSLRFRPLDVLEKEIENLLDYGFSSIKLKIGGQSNIKQDKRLIAWVRNVVGDDIRLMADANCGYGFNEAIEIGRFLEEYSYDWFEEPLSPDDIRGYAKLVDKLDIPIAGGESLFSKYDFRDWISAGALDIVQPNIARAGGFTECRKIAALASAYHVPYSPHVGSSSELTLAASIQLAASLPNCLNLEFMVSDWSRQTPNPLRSGILLDGPFSPEDGELQVPSLPGLGSEVDIDTIKTLT